jgi:hypothetical protein
MDFAMIIRLVSVCLMVTHLAGCAATRQIHFDSKPAGATVQLLDFTCTTPCVMHIASKDVQFAEISLAGGEKRFFRIEAKPSITAQVVYNASTVGATTLKYIAAPLLVVGVSGLALISGNETDSFNNRNYEVDRYGFYITMGALVSGAALAYVAYNIDKVSSDLKPEQDIYVVFDAPVEKGESNNKPSLTYDEFIGDGKVFPATIH